MKFGDEELTGKELGPVRFSFNNDAAKQHIGLARRYLGDMKQRMQLGNLGQLYDEKTLKDGSIIKMWSNKNGLADVDLIDIVSPENKEEFVKEIIILGYILFGADNTYVILPNGNQSGFDAIDTPSQSEVIEPYINHSQFYYVGFPDFGGTKRMRNHARTDRLNTPPNQNISNEFESFWSHEFTDNYYRQTSEPPPGHTWPEIIETWEERESPQSGTFGPWYQEGWAGGSPAGNINRRIDGQGFWFSFPFRWTDNGVMFLYDEEPQFPQGLENYQTVFYMMPNGGFNVEYSNAVYDAEDAYWGIEYSNSDYEYEADIENYPDEWIPDPGPEGINPWWPWTYNPATETHHMKTVHKWDYNHSEDVIVNRAKVTFPNYVPYGRHSIYVAAPNPGYSTNWNYKAVIYTTNGTIVRNITQQELIEPTEDVRTLTIMVGISGKEEELIF